MTEVKLPISTQCIIQPTQGNRQHHNYYGDGISFNAQIPRVVLSLVSLLVHTEQLNSELYLLVGFEPRTCIFYEQES